MKKLMLFLLIAAAASVLAPSRVLKKPFYRAVLNFVETPCVGEAEPEAETGRERHNWGRLYFSQDLWEPWRS